MNWPVLILVSYFLAIVQIGMASWLRWWGEASPNLLLVMLIFIGLHAPIEALVISAVLLGLGYDLMNQTPLGFGVIGFSLVGLAMIQLRQLVFREHPFSHATLGLVCGVILATILLILQWMRGFLFVTPPEAQVSMGVLLKSAVLTVPACVVVVWFLRKYRRTLGLRQSGYGM